METYEDKVKRLGDAWEMFATVIENEITAGWIGMEPPKLVRDVSSYMSAHRPEKAKEFDKRFFHHLD